LPTPLTADSIVAIHGKGAHPVDTWGALRSPGLDVKEQANWINWLEDRQMLPAEFPAARIFRYGYPSDWFGEYAVKTRAATIAAGLLDELNEMRMEHTDRPIIFIAHSFGGLVLVKVDLPIIMYELRLRGSDFASVTTREREMEVYS
jgi:predicted alpha/beta hydrolase family esterase